MRLLFHLGNAWNLLRRAPVFVVGGCLLVSAMVAASLGILIGPLYAAYMEALITLQRDGRQPQLKDLFSGLKRFRQLFPLFFLAVLILLGFMLLVIPGLLMLTLWIYALPLMADSRMTLVPALNESAAKIKEKGFFKHLGFLFLIILLPNVLLNIFAGAAGFLKAIFLVLAPPLQFGCVASLYLSNFPPTLPDAPRTGIADDLPAAGDSCH